MLKRIMSYMEQRLVNDQEFLALRKEETAINAEYTRLCIDEMKAKRENSETRAAIRALQTEVDYLTTMVTVAMKQQSSKDNEP